MKEHCYQRSCAEQRHTLWEGKKGKVFYGQEPPSGESTFTEMLVQLSTTFSNVLKQPNGELLVEVSHNQLRTMALETVDQIYWSHPPPSSVPPERLVHSINQCNLSAGTERATAACEVTTLPMRPLRERRKVKERRKVNVLEMKCFENFFYFFAPNLYCALIVALSEKASTI